MIRLGCRCDGPGLEFENAGEVHTVSELNRIKAILEKAEQHHELSLGSELVGLCLYQGLIEVDQTDDSKTPIVRLRPAGERLLASLRHGLPDLPCPHEGVVEQLNWAMWLSRRPLSHP